MMKRHNILTVLAVLLLTFAACDKNSAPGFSFTTDSILTLTFDKELDAAFVGVGTQNYNPVGMRRSGDTLFIANRAEGSDGVWVVRASTGELLYSLTGWTYNGKNEKFDNQVMDVAVSSDYIFVVNRSSRIDLFRRNDYSYVTTIGRTGWQSSSLLQCEAAEVAGDKLFIRDKQKIKVVQISDCTPENRFKVPVFAQNTDSTSSNNGFNLESVARHEGLIYVSDYETSRILVIDPATVAVKGEPVRFLRSYHMPNKPLSMGFFQNEMYVVCANNRIVRVDLRTGKELGSYSSFAGGVGLGTPGRLFFHNDTFYLAGRNANAPRLIQGKVMFVEISELD